MGETTFPLQQKLAVCTLLCMVRGRARKETSLGKLYDSYVKVRAVAVPCVHVFSVHSSHSLLPPCVLVYMYSLYILATLCCLCVGVSSPSVTQ